MKAITIHQPWASLIAHGHKRFETRSWRTNYRGPIAIHAGKKIERQAVLMLARDHTRIWHKITPLPTGCIVAVAELVDCSLVTNWSRSSVFSATSNYDGTPVIHGKEGDIFLKLDPTELRFGDYTPGRYAWELANVRLIEPIPAKGRQGLWNWQQPSEWTCVTCKEFLIGGGLCDACIEQETEIAMEEGWI